ncbi:MAG: murein biosynthesis integral membrane protein MurJ [Candidatus Binatia bacterium]|nr:murein biosynthesis integral membrane protein MurJ [Candidatus Binatia bacterium]
MNQRPCEATRVDEKRAMVRATGEIGFYTLLSRVTGLLRDVVIGSVFGAGAAADAFFVAFRIPNLLRRLVGEGAASVAIIPVVTEYLTHHSRAETEEMIRALIGVGVVVLGCCTVVGMLCAEPLTILFAPGFRGAKLDLTVALSRIVFAYLFCIGLVALAMGILHPLRYFAAPAFSPVLLNIAMILGALGLPGVLPHPIYSVAYGVVFGGLCQVMWLVSVLVRLRIPLLPQWRPCHPALRRVAGLLAPVVFGAAVYQVNVLLSTMLASLLADGSVSALWYANRLLEFPLGVFVTALGTASLPTFAVQAQRRDLGGIRESLGEALRLVNLVAVPAAVGLAVLAVPFCTVLFFRGAFGAEQVQVTATAVRGLALGLWSVAVARLLTSCLYAVEDTRTPVYAGIVAVIVNVCLSLVFMGRIAPGADLHALAGFFASLSTVLALYEGGVGGLALAASLSATIHVLYLGVVVYRRVAVFHWTPWVASLSWSLLGAAVMAAPVLWISRQVDWLDPQVSFAIRAGTLVLAVVVGMVSYGCVVWCARKNELLLLTAMLPERLLRLLPQFLQARR